MTQDSIVLGAVATQDNEIVPASKTLQLKPKKIGGSRQIFLLSIIL